MRPSAFRKGGRGERISYAMTKTELGDILVAATPRGVCSVRFGSKRDLVSELRDEFPHAELMEDAEAMKDYVRAVEERAGGIRLDARGSEFQQKVWAALREIPAGETRTYGQVAEAIGQPGAARAVARACATNPLALLTPCHRVVRADGGLGGYRWGIERKRALLEMEGAAK
jgi:AraC family transcriptional regulator of adaptative response/methylated-DNA-[protein]-cysteine methyltransferase